MSDAASARLDLARFSADAFAAVESGSAEAIALTSGIERAVLAHLLAAVSSAFEDVRAALAAAGHAVEDDGSPGELGLRAATHAGVLAVVANVGAGVSARYLDPADAAAEDAPSAEELRFRAALDEARARAQAVGFDALARDEQFVLALGGLEAEIANGGFDQYFLNSAGDHAEVALAGLEAIGARRLQRILRDALAVFPGGRAPRERDARIAAMDAIGARDAATWERLSIRYFQVDDDVATLLDAHLNGAGGRGPR